MKYIYVIILTLLFIGVDYAQLSAPSGYTTNMRLRKYAQGANAGADSINANWTAIDTYTKAVKDTVGVKVNLYGNQTIGGTKTFAATTIHNGALTINATATSNTIVPKSDDAYNLGSSTAKYADVWGVQFHGEKFLIYNTEGNDSANITLNDSSISFDRSVSFTADELLPTSAGKLGNDTSAFNSIYADTVISGESYLVLQGKQGGVELKDVFGIGAPNARAIVAATTTIDATGISYFYTSETEAVTGIATLTAGATRRSGSILVVVNGSNYNVTFKNGTGNMLLGADVTLGLYDVLTLLYYPYGGGYRWLKIGYENN